MAIAGFGKRDAPYDNRFPVVLARSRPGNVQSEPASGIVVTQLNDQHAFLDTTKARPSRLAIG